MIDIVVATGNPHKLRELRTLLADLPVRLLAPSDLPEQQRFEGAEETGDTFEANADLKAIHAARATGRHALADDSGLEVGALDGRPGVRSARYAGDDSDDGANNRKLAREVREAGLHQPAARFRCVISVAAPSGEVVARGEGASEGVFVLEPRGGGGFGYDPHFLVPALGRTFAEIGPAEKNAISHRARALDHLHEALIPWLERLGESRA
jgi:XTP/dITP diphosphohydrolase